MSRLIISLGAQTPNLIGWELCHQLQEEKIDNVVSQLSQILDSL